MPIFRLFHLDLPPRGAFIPADVDEVRYQAMMGHISGAVRLGLYTEIAHVSAPDIDALFPLTNHIDNDWTEGSAVHVSSGPARSTSVGDIAMDQETGRLRYCAMVGWNDLEPELATTFREKLGRDIPALKEPVEPEAGM